MVDIFSTISTDKESSGTVVIYSQLWIDICWLILIPFPGYIFDSEDQAMVYTAEIVSAVSHLHKSGIVHRDLKPENILMDADGHVMSMPVHLT